MKYDKSYRTISRVDGCLITFENSANENRIVYIDEEPVLVEPYRKWDEQELEAIRKWRLG